MYKDKMPTKALICYCSNEPNQPIPQVDRLVEKGCSGQLALEEEPDPKGNNTIILQLLGLNSSSDIKSEFKERFNDLSLVIVSNSEPAHEAASNLNASFKNIESAEQVHQILSSESTDIVFVDLTGFDNPWDFVNKLLSVDNVNYIQCIVSPYQLNEDKSNQFNSIIPRQSYLMKNGQEVTNLNKQTGLMYGYYHSGSGRTDNSTQYSLQNIQENCGNCKILAWHFLAEIGHKLGFVPKYGA